MFHIILYYILLWYITLYYIIAYFIILYYTLLPSDITLRITFDYIIHTMTPPRTGSVATPHHIHLYLNPHDRLPYLQHTCILGPIQNPIVLLSLPVFRVNALNHQVHGSD